MTSSRAGRIAEWQQRLARQPEDAVAWQELARLYRQSGQPAAAEDACRRALARAPESLAACCLLAMLLHESGRLGEAEPVYRQALRRKADEAGLWHNYAALLKALQRPEEALAAYRQALHWRGDYPEAYYNLGNLHDAQGQFAAAEAAYRRALQLKPDYAEAHYNLGVVLKAQDKLAEAEAAYRQAIHLREAYVEARNNLGMVLFERDGPAGGAEAQYRTAIVQAPRYAEAHNNLGVLLQERQEYDEATEAFRTALQIRADYHDAAWNLALMHLIHGRFAEAWPLFHARTRITRCQTFPPPLPFPEWQGESLAGRRIIVWPEQGYGDEIQFCRYVPYLKALGAAQVIVACKPALQRLFRRLPGVDFCLEVRDGEVQVPVADFWVFTMSLPARFGTRLETIPARLPYLAALPGSPALLPAAAGLRVGLVWQGSAAHANDRHRSLPDHTVLAPLWSIPGIEWISLQMGEAETAAIREGLPLRPMGRQLRDFADTAALLGELDLLLCVDTAVAHLAGALGRPVWVMLPFHGQDWRWLRTRCDSPWYPGKMRLFRQSTAGDWGGLLHTVRAALQVFIEDKMHEHS